MPKQLLDLWNQVENQPQTSSNNWFKDPFWATQWYMVTITRRVSEIHNFYNQNIYNYSKY